MKIRVKLATATRLTAPTTAEDAVLRDEWAADVGVEALALRLGRSRTPCASMPTRSVCTVPRVAGAGPSPTTRSCATATDGLTCQRIADDLGARTAGAVAARARKRQEPSVGKLNAVIRALADRRARP
jgi:hypothetical protein